MRQVRPHSWLLLLVMGSVMTGPAAYAQSAEIVFSSDREGSDFLEVWVSSEDGTKQDPFTNALDQPTQLDCPTSEPDYCRDRNRPSICDDGRRIFYDNYYEQTTHYGDLFAKSTFSGTGQKVLACGSETGSPDCFGVGALDWCPGGNPPFAPAPQTTGPCGCRAADCGPPAPGSQADARILFEYMNPPQGRHNIVMATWDASSGTLGLPCKLTSDGGTPYPHTASNENPAWCGNRHAVFMRYNHEHQPDTFLEEYAICTVKVDAPGEYNCHIIDDGNDERYPSCGLRNGEWTVAYAMEKTGAANDVSRICTVRLDQSTFEFVPGSEVCTPESPDEIPLDVDWTKPVWAPGGLQIAFAANMDENRVKTTTYDICRINSQEADLTNGNYIPHTQNADEDNDPDWGPTELEP